jgi:hypothetical protein
MRCFSRDGLTKPDGRLRADLATVRCPTLLPQRIEVDIRGLL